MAASLLEGDCTDTSITLAQELELDLPNAFMHRPGIMRAQGTKHMDAKRPSLESRPVRGCSSNVHCCANAVHRCPGRRNTKMAQQATLALSLQLHGTAVHIQQIKADAGIEKSDVCDRLMNLHVEVACFLSGKS